MKKIFMGYCAFAPFIALAMACQLSGLLGIRDDEELIRLAFTVVVCTVPFCGWLYASCGHLGLAYVLADAHLVILALPFIPRRCYEFSIILALLIAGYGILLVWDKHTIRLKKDERLEKFADTCKSRLPSSIRASISQPASRWESRPNPDIIDDECPDF